MAEEEENGKGKSSSSTVMAEDQEDKPLPVIVRVKRKPDQSPLQALWLEINERPLKRPLLDFQKLSISSSSREELKSRRVLVQHVETLNTSEATLDFLHSFVQSSTDNDAKLKTSSSDRRSSLQKDKKLDQLLSKARQEQQNLAKSARFEQIWKRRREKKEAIDDEALGEVCRVYDVLRVDEETSGTVEQQEELSVEDQEMLGKFLPLLREYIPCAAEDIESDICSHAMIRDSANEYVYDLYAVKDNIDETETSYPFPLIQVDDDDFYDGPEDSDYETDDSNAENNPVNDYPDEESIDDEEEKSEKSDSESDDDSQTESDAWMNSDDSERFDRSRDPLDEDEMDGNYNDDSDYADDGDGESWRWAYR